MRGEGVMGLRGEGGEKWRGEGSGGNVVKSSEKKKRGEGVERVK